MSPGNQDKTKAAPVTVIIGMDMAFYEQLPKLVPACGREMVERPATSR